MNSSVAEEMTAPPTDGRCHSCNERAEESRKLRARLCDYRGSSNRCISQPLSTETVQNDYGYEIPFVLQDSLGNAVTLVGARLSLEVQSAQDRTQTLLSLTGSLTIDSATGGTCHYTVSSGDFANPGTFLASVAATWGGETLTWSGLKIIV